ncbi:DMT family transporter [Inhella gelatinilytica]|uniref:DMT family transporter n=1 Tax=Inhella gelatinilytica TaxID=2795030 RepID=A0A931N9Y5_9BURK|nr:DMT family transporter [Inhella gelatinilytica]MBH9551883.1 DMT family transporter [Inhella gelatinilytica]
MWSGTLFALAAGLMWGLVFVAPLMLPEYPASWLTLGRYLAFGLICLPLAWVDRRALRQLQAADWRMAVRLSLVGNFLYYLALAAAIQRAGNPLVSALIGTLPVVIAVVSNRRNALRDGHLPWRRLAPSLVAIAAGLACINQTEWQTHAQTDASRYGSGALLALVALAAWTWYPIRNADWLREHPDRSPRAWATAQGLVSLPLALLGMAALAAGAALGWAPVASPFDSPLGPNPAGFVGLMLLIGLAASWGGTLCWNEASQRLPTALAGQLIVFETLSALAYGYLWRGQWPSALAATGIALLIGGVIWALRVKPVPADDRVYSQVHS